MMKDDLLKRMLSRSKSKDDNHLDSPAEVTNRRKIMKVAHQRSNSDPLSPNVLNNLWKRSLSNHAVTATATDAMAVGNGTLPRTFTRTTSKGRKQILEEILASKVRSDSQDTQLDEEEDISPSRRPPLHQSHSATDATAPHRYYFERAASSSSRMHADMFRLSGELSPMTQFLNRLDTPSICEPLGSASGIQDGDMETCLDLFRKLSSSESSVVMSEERGVLLRDGLSNSQRSYSDYTRFGLLRPPIGVAQSADSLQAAEDNFTAADLLSLFSRSSQNSGSDWRAPEEFTNSTYVPSALTEDAMEAAAYAASLPDCAAPPIAAIAFGHPHAQQHMHQQQQPLSSFPIPSFPSAYPMHAQAAAHQQVEMREPMLLPSTAALGAQLRPAAIALPPMYARPKIRPEDMDDALSPQNLRMAQSFGQLQLSRQQQQPVPLRPPLVPAAAPVIQSDSSHSVSSNEQKQKKGAAVTLEKNNRGNYHCGRCGMIKANHVCPFVDAPPCLSKEVQVGPMVLQSCGGTWEGFEGEKFITVRPRGGRRW